MPVAFANPVVRDRQPIEPPPPQEPPTSENNGDDGEGGYRDWVTVATFWQPMDAQMARIRLVSEGIDCVLLDENLVATDWLYANAVGGIKVQVPAADSERAVMALQRPSADVEGPAALPYGGGPQIIPIAMFNDGGEAELAATVLAGHDIIAHVRTDAPMGDAADLFERFSLTVDAHDAARAAAFLRATPARSKLIDQDNDADLADDGIREDRVPNAPQCPTCGSMIVRRRFATRRSAALAILLLGFPLPFISRRWTCGSCGHEWM